MGKNKKILAKQFFKKSAVEIAPTLLGKYLVKEGEGGLMINDVEVYYGFHDKASHAHKGQTDRNKIMFSEGGFWYVYLIYGMYEMLNLVTGKSGHPEAILIRGAGKYDGPGKLTKSIGIDRSFNNKEVSNESGLWIEDRGVKVRKNEIIRKKRVGINYAGEKWKNKDWRFVYKPTE